MTSDQQPLFDDIRDDDGTDSPRCRMCARPARWVHTQQRWAMYCGGSGGCTNRERICQACDQQFVMNVDGAGTKYCSTKCKQQGYTAGHAPRYRTFTCEWCGETSNGTWARSNAWPYICSQCTEPIKHVVPRLRKHHVPHERARQLLTDPTCEVCSRDIVAKVQVRGSGKPQALLVVDHDHACCPSGAYSCGQCIRGLICTQCNAAAGMLGDDEANALSLAYYLARFSRD